MKVCTNLSLPHSNELQAARMQSASIWVLAPLHTCSRTTINLDRLCAITLYSALRAGLRLSSGSQTLRRSSQGISEFVGDHAYDHGASSSVSGSSLLSIAAISTTICGSSGVGASRKSGGGSSAMVKTE